MENNPSNHLTNLEKSLPSLCYYDEDFYNKELSEIWSKNWIYVCHKSRLSKKLSYETIKLGKQSVIIIKDSKDKLKAYYNTCRHRGSILCQESSGKLSSKAFVCPYHQWSYHIDTGELLKIASFSNTPDGFDNSLIRSLRSLSVFPIFTISGIAGFEIT